MASHGTLYLPTLSRRGSPHIKYPNIKYRDGKDKVGEGAIQVLRSQQLRRVNYQGDGLRLGMDWTREDLKKPQVLVESVYGSSHPGSFHLDAVGQSVQKGVTSAGGKAAQYFVTDICDGIAQSHDGMNFSLLSREMICNMVEIHAMASPYDGLVLLSSCDKAVPAHLMAMARLDLPAIHVPGGANISGPNFISSDILWSLGDRWVKGEVSEQKFLDVAEDTCPSCGACQFMGTASTMQAMSEALGLALPGTAMLPVILNDLHRLAQTAGTRILALIKEGLTPRHILTREAFENAMMVHAAIGGSSNATLHIPAIAHEAGIDIDAFDFDRLQRDIPVMANVKTAGKYPTEYFWYAGGIPYIMELLRDRLHLDCLTVTGKTVGENLDWLNEIGYFQKCRQYLEQRQTDWQDVIPGWTRPVYEGGDIAVLTGNLAPEGAVVKARAVTPEMMSHVGPAVPCDSEEEALVMVLERKLQVGDVLIIRNEGPKGSGMPEMFHTTEALMQVPEYARGCAIITDGRYSGATRGPAIGHVSPEARDGGPIALVEAGDLIDIDIPGRRLNIVGIHGHRESPEIIDRVLTERRTRLVLPPLGERGALGIYRRLATSAIKGATIG